MFYLTSFNLDILPCRREMNPVIMSNNDVDSPVQLFNEHFQARLSPQMNSFLSMNNSIRSFKLNSW